MAAADLVGQRFGDLTVIREDCRRDGNVVWLCECSCGGSALRTTARLRYAVKCGQVPCCRVCHEELMAGVREAGRRMWRERRARTRELYRILWDEHGTLYSGEATARLEAEIAGDLFAEFGVLADDPDVLRMRDHVRLHGAIQVGQVWQPGEQPVQRPWTESMMPGTELGHYYREPLSPAEAALERHEQWIAAKELEAEDQTARQLLRGSLWLAAKELEAMTQRWRKLREARGDGKQ